MRPLTQDYNLFKEAILAYNRNTATSKNGFIKKHNTSSEKRLYGYLLIEFDLYEDLQFSDFTILKSISVDLGIQNSIGQKLRKAFICPVLMPSYVNYHHSHLFTLALSAICSFAFERPVFSTSDDFYNGFKIVSEPELKKIGSEFPQTVLGSSRSTYKPHNEILRLWKDRFDEIIKLINFSIDHGEILDYQSLFQSMRIIQLGHQNKKNDFDLAFSLLIAGIESISQLAIPQIYFSKQHEKYKEWKKETQKSESLKLLLSEYRKFKEYLDNNIKHRDLTKRFVEFILTYCPTDKWSEVLYMDLIIEGLEVRKNYEDEISSFPEMVPENLTREELIKIIKQTYQFRSKFLHTGKPTPHTFPNNSLNERYFQVIDNPERRNKLLEKMERENRNKLPYSEWSKTQDILIKFELMSTIARVSITEYAKNQYKTYLAN
ncbi:hypothetical protein [Leeuwenhoekiella nanhaiensis]|uniref:Uncharacterized protein n=1 Tax=Leeuwenhoekiella nanhaiensis TaxID=1655491 RepID=A0A2G1VP54_9FLAO|nr:hypothetical protein [Leeuwenhoekiella nanhaiensis]PHQ28548.1 hypothetical protein CJ305_14760 [Leeuwenhoekiella nanhaiensis]